MNSWCKDSTLKIMKTNDLIGEYNALNQKYKFKENKLEKLHFEEANILNLEFCGYLFSHLTNITLKKCNILNSMLSENFFFKLYECIQLDLSYNNLTKIPNFQAIKLEVLNLSYNNIEVIDKSFFKEKKNLTYINLSNNNINFQSALELKTLIMTLKKLNYLKNLNVDKNKFLQIYMGCQYHFICELIDNLTIFNDEQIDVENIKKNKETILEKFRAWEDENENENMLDIDREDEKDLEIPCDFSIFIRYIEDCLQRPSDIRDWLNKLKIKSMYIIDRNEESINVFHQTVNLKEQMQKFLTKITILIENQEITQWFLFDILAKLTQINQENFGNMCYVRLDILIKKNRHFKKCISIALKDNCLNRFKKNNIKEIQKNQFVKFTDILLNNELYNITDKDMYKYLNSWFSTIIENNLNLFFDEILWINIFKFAYLTVKSTEIEIDFIKLILDIFFIYRENKEIFTENKRNYKLIFLEYISKLISLFCIKDSKCEHINFLEDNNFYTLFIDELNENLREIEIISKGNNYKSNPYITQLCNSFSFIIMAFGDILENSKDNIEVNNPIYMKNEETKKLIFQEIGYLHLNTNLPITMTTSILKFMNNCLYNTKLLKDGNNLNFVKLISDTINYSYDLLKSLEKMDKKLNEEQDEINYIISVCNIIYFYCYNSNMKNDELGQFCIEISNQLDKLERETILFSFLTTYNDDLKLAIVEILNSIRFDQYNYEEIEKIYDIVQKCKNVGTGKNELILGTLLLILAKIIKLTDHNENFIQNYGKDSIFDFLELLYKNIKRDVRDDIDEQEEKDTLSCSFIFFFMILKEFYILTDKNDIKKADNYISKILKSEYKLSVRVSAPIEIEKTIIKDKIDNLMTYIKELVPGKSIQFFRLINHLANILENYKYESPNLEEKHFIISDILEYFNDNLNNYIKIELDNFKIKENVYFTIKEKNELSDIHSYIISYSGINKIIDRICMNLKDNEKDSLVNIKASNEIEFNKNYEEFKKKLTTNKKVKSDNNFLNIFSKIINVNNKNKKIDQKSKDWIENELKTLDINKIQNEGEAFRYLININIPEMTINKQKIEIHNKENFLNHEDNDLVYEKKILTINLNCILRIIYNLLEYSSNPENLKDILKTILDFNLISKITKLCELVGWNSFYISSKYIIIMKKILELRFNYFINESFNEYLPFYDLTFTNLSKIIKFIQKDFSKDNITYLNNILNLHILKDITYSTYKIINILLKQLEQLNEPYTSKIFELHSNNDDSQIPHSQFIINFYIPIEFILVFIEIKIYLIKYSYKNKESNSEYQNLIFNIIMNIKNILAKYIYIFPNKKFNIIKHFFKYSELSEFSIHSSVINDILNYSSIIGKKNNLKVLFDNKNYFNIDDNSIALKYKKVDLCFYSINVNKIGVKNVYYLMINNFYFYLATCSEENKCNICNSNSLCPKEPKLDSFYKIDSIEKVIVLPDKKSIYFKFQNSKTLYLEFLTEEVVNEIEYYLNMHNIKLKKLKLYNKENFYLNIFPTGFIINKKISQEQTILHYYLKNNRYLFLINKIEDLLEVHVYSVDYENLDILINDIDDLSDDGTGIYINLNKVYSVNEFEEINIINSIHSNFTFKRHNDDINLLFTNSESGELFKININPFNYKKKIEYNK